MAYIEERKNGWLVVWREDDKKKSRLIPWQLDERFEVLSKEDARSSADALAAEMKTRERGYGKPRDRVAKWAKEGGYEPIFGDSDFIGKGEDGQRFENYVAALIDGGAITESAKHTYRHTLTNHIAGTPLGRKNVRFVDERDIEDFWRALTVGDGARRNIAQVLRKGFPGAQAWAHRG
jgi:hypothetical protein